MTLGHVAGLGIISHGIRFASENYNTDLSANVPASRIVFEACNAGAAFVGMNVLTTGIRISLLTVATSGVLLAATAYATIMVVGAFFEALKVRKSNGAVLSYMAITILTSFFSTAALSKQFGLVSSFGEFLNVGFTATVGAVGLLFTGFVVTRIYLLLFMRRSFDSLPPL